MRKVVGGLEGEAVPVRDLVTLRHNVEPRKRNNFIAEVSLVQLSLT